MSKKILLFTCSANELLGQQMKLLAPLIAENNLRAIIRPGSVKVLCGEGSKEALAEISLLLKDDVRLIILIAHENCWAYAGISQERQFCDLKNSRDLLRANFRNTPVVTIWAKLAENGKDFIFRQISFGETGKRLFSPEIEGVKKNGELIFSES